MEIDNGRKMTYFHVSDTFGKDIIPIDVGFEISSATKKPIESAYPYYMLHCIADGKGYFRVNGKNYKLKKGHMFLVRPNVQIFHYPDAKKPWSFYWINFSGLECKELLNKTDFAQNDVISAKSFMRILKHYKNALQVKNQHHTQGLLVLCEIYSILSILIEDCHSVKNTDNNKNETIDFYLVLDYVEKNIFNPDLNAALICKKFFFSPSYFSRLFSEHMGSTFVQHINRERIKKATELLLDTNLLIKEIALNVGFTDSLYFSKVFKTHRLLSPESYRLANKG